MNEEYDWCVTFIMYDNKSYDSGITEEDTFFTPKIGDKHISLFEQSAYIKNLIITETRHNSADWSNKLIVFYIEITIDEKNKIHQATVYQAINGQNAVMSSNIVNIDYLIGTNKQSIEQLLSNTVNITNAKNNVLITIGHGSIFGINMFESSNRNNTTITNNILTQEIKYGLNQKQLNFLKEVRIEYNNIKNDFNKLQTIKFNKNQITNFGNNELLNFTNNFIAPAPEVEIELEKDVFVNLLTNIELKEAIDNIYLKKGKKLDVLVLDACLMQNQYTQFEFAGSVEYLVAANSGITYPGFNYAAMIKMIREQNDIAAKEIAGVLISSINSSEVYKNGFDSIIENTWCVSAVQLDKILLKVINDKVFAFLNLIIKKENKTVKEITKDIIQGSFKYEFHAIKDEIGIIDAYFLFVKLKERVLLNAEKVKIFKPELILNPLNILIDLIAQLNKKTNLFVGKNYYTPNDHNFANKTNKNLARLMLCLPLEKTNYNLIENLFISTTVHTPTAWGANNEYGQFVNQFRKL